MTVQKNTAVHCVLYCVRLRADTVASLLKQQRRPVSALHLQRRGFLTPN